MKRKHTRMAALLLALAAALSGCSSGDDGQSAPTATPTEVVQATPTPVPTPVPTSVPVVSISDYRYQTISNSTLHVSFQYPSHWLSSPGRQTICYIEPVESGGTSARLAVSSVAVEKTPDAHEMQTQMNRFIDLITGSYTGFALGESRDDIAVLGGTGLRQKYTALNGAGEELTGYVLMAYDKTQKRIYLLHFTAPVSKYILLSSVIDAARTSMTAID